MSRDLDDEDEKDLWTHGEKAEISQYQLTEKRKSLGHSEERKGLAKLLLTELGREGVMPEWTRPCKPGKGFWILF